MQKELELVQLLASLNEKIDIVEKQLKYSTDLSVKIERLVEDVSSIKASMGELQFMLMGDGQNMGLVTRVAGLEKNFDDREKFMEKTVEPAMEKLNEVFQAASQEMYAAQQEAQGAEGAPQGDAEGAEAGGDEVTDVDFEEVKDEEAK